MDWFYLSCLILPASAYSTVSIDVGLANQAVAYPPLVFIVAELSVITRHCRSKGQLDEPKMRGSHSLGRIISGQSSTPVTKPSNSLASIPSLSGGSASSAASSSSIWASVWSMAGQVFRA